jgi:GNAT superfamily N-acetyltransferase
VSEPDLAAFLTQWLGAWPDADGLTVVASEQRERPSWDGSIRDVVGVGTAERAVISVAPALADAVRAQVRTWEDVPSTLPAAVGKPAARAFFGTFRWTLKPTDLPDAGVWVPRDDPRVPAWLRPFNGDVLIAFDDGADDSAGDGTGGTYAAGVGIKRHNAAGMELSVGTEERYRGRGLASRLVSQASRWVLAQGAVPIYLHDPANTASDRTALAAGFPDEGWQILGVWSGSPS